MAGLQAAAVLDLWERAEHLDLVERTLALAAAGGPPVEVDELASLPLGARDARLLRLRTELAGRSLVGTAACPGCGGWVEFAADADEILAADAGRSEQGPVEVDGYLIRWRAPDSRDLAAASAANDTAGAERILLARCVLSVTAPDGEDAVDPLPAAARAAVARAMAAGDPLAEVLVDVTCPACSASFVADLDLAGFVWAEVCASAERLLREVAVLAGAFGWTESETLGLGDERRAAYLRLAHEGGA
ncbi:MAG: hypothetical protein ABIR67_15255 [Gaiellaceae bacterium]